MIGGGPFYTEDVAKSKWCPHQQHTCEASFCMAWRWQPLLADDAFKEAVIKRREETKDTGSNQKQAVEYVMANRARYNLPEKPYLGYCGLAGEFLT